MVFFHSNVPVQMGAMSGCSDSHLQLKYSHQLTKYVFIWGNVLCILGVHKISTCVGSDCWYSVHTD